MHTNKPVMNFSFSRNIIIPGIEFVSGNPIDPTPIENNICGATKQKQSRGCTQFTVKVCNLNGANMCRLCTFTVN